MAEKYVVGGIAFGDKAEAEKAESEARRIEALNTRIDYSNPRAVGSLYQKAQANRVFKTPIGVSYMLRLREFLAESGVPEQQIPPVDLTDIPSKPQEDTAGEGGAEAVGADEAVDKAMLAKREKVFEARLRSQKSMISRQLGVIKMQWAVMAVMGLMIIAMFIISLTGNNPTIINYRSKILNQYAQWEQELTERENALSLKEQAAGAGIK